MTLSHLNIIDLQKNKYDVDIELSATILDLKNKIVQQYNLEDPSKLRIICDSKILTDNFVLQDAGLSEKSIIKVFFQKGTPSRSNSENIQPISEENVSTNTKQEFIPNPINIPDDKSQNLPPPLYNLSDNENSNIIFQIREQLLSMNYMPKEVDKFLYCMGQYFQDVQQGVSTFLSLEQRGQIDSIPEDNIEAFKASYESMMSLFGLGIKKPKTQLLSQTKYTDTLYDSMLMVYKKNKSYEAYKALVECAETLGKDVSQIPLPNTTQKSLKTVSQQEKIQIVFRKIKAREQMDVRREFSNLTRDQQYDCNLLFIEGYEMEQIIKLYIACDCDIALAREILKIASE